MYVRIDPARQDEQTGGIEYAFVARGNVESADFQDLFAADPHVCLPGARRGDDRSTAYQQIAGEYPRHDETRD